MKDSNKRFLRTIYQGVLALIVAVPALVAVLPTQAGRIGQIAGVAVAAVAFMAKAVNTLEDKGLIPAFLKNEPKPKPKRRKPAKRTSRKHTTSDVAEQSEGD